MFMKKYILSAFCDEAAKDLDGQIAALKRNGISHAEIRNVDGAGIVMTDLARVKEIAKIFRENGISVSAVGSPIGKTNITDDFAPALELFKYTLDVAQTLGTQRIRMFSFYIPEGESAAVYRDEVMARIGTLLDLAGSAGVTCCHENESGIYGDTAARCLDLLTAFKGKLRGIFDPANYIMCGESPAEIFDDLAGYTDYFHIKDAVAQTKTIVPAGMGDGGLEDILTRFYGRADGTFLSIEPHLKVFPGSRDAAARPIDRQFAYLSKGEAFDAAARHLKGILDKNGFAYE